MEASKREYIEKLKRELDVVEDKWLAINNENCMVGEDYRSQALQLHNIIANLNRTIQSREAALIERQDLIDKQVIDLTEANEQIENQTMYSEDLLVQMSKQNETGDKWQEMFQAEEEKKRELTLQLFSA